MSRNWSATLPWVGVFTLVAGLGIATAQGSQAGRKPQPPPSTASDRQASAQPAGEREFVSQLAMSNMTAIQLGHAATKQAQRPEIQAFAKSTIDLHLKAQKQLADAGYGAGIQWPTKLDDKNRQAIERVSRSSKEQFDREYMKETTDRLRDLEKRLAARATEGAGSAVSDGSPLTDKVNQWAARVLPELQAHLKQGEQLFGQLEKAE
jgi:predicted outer membrane protein